MPEFRVISRFWERTAVKRMKIDPQYQRRNCSLLNVLFTLILQGIPSLGGVKNVSGGKKQTIFELNASISRKR